MPEIKKIPAPVLDGHLYPRLVAAVRSLGRTNDERAEAIGRSRRTISEYLHGHIIPDRETIASHPLLLAAFCADAHDNLTGKSSA